MTGTPGTTGTRSTTVTSRHRPSEAPGQDGHRHLYQRVITSIQASAQHAPLTDASWEIRRGSADLSTRSATLNLSAPAVAKLGAQSQQLLRRLLRGHQPARAGHRQDRRCSSEMKCFLLHHVLRYNIQ